MLEVFTVANVKNAVFGDVKRRISLIEVTDVSKERTASNFRIEV
jgi:hypothetical protein